MKKTARTWMLLCIICFAGLYSINGFLLSPACTVLSNDVIFAESALPILLEYLAEIVELCAISSGYAVMIALLYKFGVGTSSKILLIFAGATAYKYAVNTVMSWIFVGSVPAEWLWDIVNIVFYTALEFLQALIIYLIVKEPILRYNQKRNAMVRAAARIGEGAEPLPLPAYPFKALYEKGNCLLRSALVCAIVTFVAKLGGTLISDIWSIILYGLPREGITWLLMLLNYLSKALFGAIVYFVIYAVISTVLKACEMQK